MDGFELNKIAAAILLAGLTAMSVSMAVNGLYGGDAAHHGDEVKRGYEIEVAEVETAGGEEEEDKPINIALFFEQASLEKGEKLSKACVACHSFEKGGNHKVGPAMWGVVGSDIGRHTDYSYSNAMASFEGNWDYQALSQFLEKPKKYMKGTKMAYAGMRKPEDRASILLYLQSLSDTPVPLPEPPVEEPAEKPSDEKLIEENLDDTVDALPGTDELEAETPEKEAE